MRCIFFVLILKNYIENQQFYFLIKVCKIQKNVEIQNGLLKRGLFNVRIF